MSWVKRRWTSMGALLDGRPLIILEHGRPIKERIDKERVDEADILMAARELQGLERLEQIKYAVLETDGKITIVPAET